MNTGKFDMIEDGMVIILAVDHSINRSHFHKVHSLTFILRSIQEGVINNT
jgi:hypothetical protein